MFFLTVLLVHKNRLLLVEPCLAVCPSAAAADDPSGDWRYIVSAESDKSGLEWTISGTDWSRRLRIKPIF